MDQNGLEHIKRISKKDFDKYGKFTVNKVTRRMQGTEKRTNTL